MDPERERERGRGGGGDRKDAAPERESGLMLRIFYG